MEVARSNILVVVFLIIFIIYLFIFFIYLFFAVFDEGLSLLHRQKTDICCRRQLNIINFITSCNLLTTVTLAAVCLTTLRETGEKERTESIGFTL